MKKLFAAAAVSVAMAVAPASAGTISFADFAAGNEGGIENRSSVNFDGTVITFVSGTGSAASGRFSTTEFNPYFDDVSGGKPAGVGVCRRLDGPGGVGDTGADCFNPGDDSIDGEQGINEMLVLIFSGGFDIRMLSFRDGDHNDINNSSGLISWGAYTIAGFIGGTNTFAELVALAAAGGLQGVNELGLSYVDTDFYLEAVSDVPIPGAIPLLLSGLAGLGFASRKKKAA